MSLTRHIGVFNDFKGLFQGFTLAEVLITLGIIGVVAAITIPVLMAEHRKKVTAVRLKQFSSIWQQAAQSVYYKNGDQYYWGTLVALNPQSTLDFYNENFGKFITTTEVEKSKYGITAALPNGSGFYFYRWSNQAETSGRTYLTFCPYYKDCRELAATAAPIPGEQISDGKKTFSFYLSGRPPTMGRFGAWDGTRERLVEECKSSYKGLCTKLIEYDSWEIKNDYPSW